MIKTMQMLQSSTMVLLLMRMDYRILQTKKYKH
uniref:Uncharacterized protein n=1 Tax=virus sp. ctrcb4 TaxID=2825824 RepID=A0A8S5RP64_9VIRU|nr:MAG TPA: hypothetical protein [virus sp. ctrcb4]DAR12802.1 MAG TPA: hypothetical protein [Crassvirales sp.]